MNQIFIGNVLSVAKQLPRRSVNTIITSPPYYMLRDYGLLSVEWPEVSFIPVAGLPPINIPAQKVQLGQEIDPWAYVGHIVSVFRALRPCLKLDGSIWVNVGDTYAANRGYQVPDSKHLSETSNRTPMRVDNFGLKPKDMMGIPWRIAQALQADGWYLRADIIWYKNNVKPASYKDRPTTTHEYIFLLTKSEQYYYNANEVMEPGSSNSHGGKKPNAGYKDVLLGKWTKNTGLGMTHSKRNKRSVWIAPEQAIEIIIKTGLVPEPLAPFFEAIEEDELTTVLTSNIAKYSKAHFATWPEKLPETMILATCPVDGVVLDPFLGSGTTAAVAKKLGRRWVGIELNRAYTDLAYERINGVTPPMFVLETGQTYKQVQFNE